MPVSLDGTVLGITLFGSQANTEAAEVAFDEEMPAKLGRCSRTGRAGTPRYAVALEAR